MKSRSNKDRNSTRVLVCEPEEKGLGFMREPVTVKFKVLAVFFFFFSQLSSKLKSLFLGDPKRKKTQIVESNLGDEGGSSSGLVG